MLDIGDIVKIVDTNREKHYKPLTHLKNLTCQVFCTYPKKAVVEVIENKAFTIRGISPIKVKTGELIGTFYTISNRSLECSMLPIKKNEKR